MSLKNKIAQKREKNLIILLSGFCAYVFMGSVFRNIMLAYELGKWARTIRTPSSGTWCRRAWPCCS